MQTPFVLLRRLGFFVFFKLIRKGMGQNGNERNDNADKI